MLLSGFYLRSAILYLYHRFYPFVFAACCLLPTASWFRFDLCAFARAILRVNLRLNIRLLSAMETYFCLSPSPDKQNAILCAPFAPLREASTLSLLCVSAVKSPNPYLRKSAVSTSSPNLASFASLQLAPWSKALGVILGQR